MDEQTLKVIACFTPIGKPWPKGAWIFVTSNMKTSSGSDYRWFRAIDADFTRQSDELSEIEANQRGWFRDGDRDRYGRKYN
jgi:hypothetical protein